MRSLLYGLILVIVGIFTAMTFEWAKSNFVPTPVTIQNVTGDRVQFPDYDHLRKNALRRFAEISPSKRARLRANLQAAMSGLDHWLKAINAAPPDLVCVGEHHDDVTRAFLARQFFSRYVPDVLMLEIRDRDLEILVALMQAGTPRLSLLGADITGIIRTVKLANPRVSIYAIEESRRQMLVRLDRRAGSREDSILANFRQRFVPGKRNVILYGALHCADDPQWLLHRIHTRKAAAGSTLSVNVINAHGSGGIEAFVNFAEEIGLPSPPFVFPRTSVLDPEWYGWFPPLAHLLQRYDAAVVFDGRVPDLRKFK